MTRAKLLAHVMGERYTTDRSLRQSFGEEWVEPMRGLMDLRLVGSARVDRFVTYYVRRT